MTDFSHDGGVTSARLIGAVAGSAISLVYLLPKHRREAAVRFLTGVACGLIFGGPTGLWGAARLGIEPELSPAEIMLAGGHSAIERKARVEKKQDALKERLSDWGDAARDAYLARHYPAYWIKTDVGRQEKHARFMARAEAEGRTTATLVETDQFRGVTELTILAPDHPRLLAIVTGACAASGGNIVDAQIFTTTDGLVLDTISVSRAFDRDDDELRRAERIAAAIERALKGEIKIADLVAQRRAPPPRDQTFQVAPEVIIDNVLSARHTVLEIAGLDRPGLLYDLTTAIGKLNLNIASAHIATFGEKAVDVFYVTDLTNAKIVSTARQLAIRKALLEVFEPEGEKAAATRARAPARA